MEHDLFGNPTAPEKPAEIDNSPTIVNGQELAEWLGITPSAVTRLKQAGRLAPVTGGYALKASIQKYLSTVRKSSERGSPRDLDQQKKFWDVENAKQKNYRWRLDYGRELIQAYIRAHRSSLEQFRQRLAKNSEALAAALAMQKAVDATAVDEVLLDVSDEGGAYVDQE